MMTKPFSGAALFAVGLFVVACSSSESNDATTKAGTSTAGGALGASVGSSGGASGSVVTTSGAGGDSSTATGAGGEAGSSSSSGGGAGGSSSSGSGGAPPMDDAAVGGGGTAGSADAGTDASVGADGGGVFAWYEAEATSNEFGNGSKVVNCGAGACASMASIMEGAACCSGGKKVGNILGRKGGFLQINAVAAPSDATYDVTWWYHCGKSDNFGDTDCGGMPHTPSGCRPHVFVVNGVQLPKVYHFPCFPGSWDEIHASTVALPLKAGTTNTIKVFAPSPRDAADMDAIAVVPEGKGVPPRITPTDR